MYYCYMHITVQLSNRLYIPVSSLTCVVVTVGFDTPELSLNVLEGEDLRLCVIVRSHVWLELERDFEVNIFTEDGTATSMFACLFIFKFRTPLIINIIFKYRTPLIILSLLPTILQGTHTSSLQHHHPKLREFWDCMREFASTFKQLMTAY